MLDTSHLLVRSLLAERVVTDADVKAAHEHAAKRGVNVVDGLIATGVMTPRRVAIERARLCEYPFVDLSWFEVDFSNTKLIPKAVVERLVAFPLFCIDGVATVGMLDPLNLQAIDQLRQYLKLDIDPVLCDADQLKALIARAYGMAATQNTRGTNAKNSEDEDLTTGEEPIVAATNQIIVGAVESGASDIHINPDENEVLLRYRIDGVLQPQQAPAKAAHQGIVQRLKVLAKLDLAQSRRPQDGKFRFSYRDTVVDIRLSVVPTIHGENVVMRLLRSSNTVGKLQDLMMPPQMTTWFEEAISRPHGMILVTGPTGSGKTSTLYCGLSHINSSDINIMTIEDPVEIRLPMVRQVQVNHEIGLTFASALRSILRQDPDVVLVGEIRDEETAKIAVQAALTGHLVFSTVHTNDSVSSITRLKDFGVQPFAINNALLCAMAQRLVRRICDSCARPETPSERTRSTLALSADQLSKLRHGGGCDKCRNSGYRGRLGVYEMLRVTPKIQRLIETSAPAADIQAAATTEGFRPLWQDGLDKALRGLTTADEVVQLVTIESQDAAGPSGLRMSA